MKTNKPQAKASVAPAVPVTQRIKEAVAANQKKADAAVMKLRDKLTVLAEAQLDLSDLMSDKTIDAAELKKRATAISGSMARILSPYRRK